MNKELCMNFKKIIGILLSLSLMIASVALASCTDNESPEITTPATTEAQTEPATQPEETEAETEPLVEVECSFSILDQDGTPISNVTAYFTHQNAQLPQVKISTDENGKASATLWEGSYTLSYENLPEGHLPDDVRMTVVKGTADYVLKVINNIPNGTEERPFSVHSETMEVKIPANTSYTYVLFNAMNRTIVIENTTLKVSYKSVEYAPDENGTVSVLLTNESPRDPGYFTLINTTDAEVEATLRIVSAPGSMENPYAIEALDENVVAAVAKDTTVYYKWVATKTGVLMVTSHTPNNHITLSNLTNSTVSYFTNGAAATYLNVTAGDEILISVAIGRSDKNSTEVVFKLTEHTATAEDSIPVWEGDFNFTLTSGATYTFTTNETVLVGLLSVKGKDVKVVFNGESYEPNEKGIVELPVSGEGNSLTFAVENQSTERQEITVSVTAPQQP